MKTLQLSGRMKVIQLDSKGHSIPQTVADAIACAVESSDEGKARVKALKGVKWVLRSGSFFVGPMDAELNSTLVQSRDEALVFDGRDNEEMKAGFFSALFGSDFTPELL